MAGDRAAALAAHMAGGATLRQAAIAAGIPYATARLVALSAGLHQRRPQRQPPPPPVLPTHAAIDPERAAAGGAPLPPWHPIAARVLAGAPQL